MQPSGPRAADWPQQPPASPPAAFPHPNPRPAWDDPGRPGAPGAPGQPPGPPPPSPPPAGRTGLVVAIAVVAVALVLAVGVVVVTGTSGDDEASPTSTTTSTTAPTTTTPPTTREPVTPPPSTSTPGVDPADIEAEVAELSTFVEQERGLEFLEPVAVEALPPDEFRDRVLEEFQTEADEMVRQGRLLEAMGLLPEDLDVMAAQEELLGSGVLGFYDPATEELVVRAEQVGPFFREIVVHELTHALDDQHFDLDRPETTERGDDGAWAFLALVEGNARRVEYAYVDQLSDADTAELSAEQLQLGLDQMGMLEMPMTLPLIIQAPYDYGAPFVEHLLASGGQERVDAAFGAPPLSSEQILEPEVFDAGQGPVPVPAPPADGEVLDEGTLGALMTAFLLQGEVGFDQIFDDVLSGDLSLDDLLGGEGGDGTDPGSLDDLLGGGGGPGGLTDPEALSRLFGPDPVDGWGGDRYVLWSGGDGGTCIRVDWVMDTPGDLAVLTDDLETWAEDSGATVEEPTPDTVRATRCS